MPDATLRELQEWLCGYLRQPGTDDAVEAAAADAIQRNVHGLAGGGLRTYREQYRLRMLGALRDDFPRVAKFVGDEAFAALVLAYVGHSPSRFYNISRLRDGFAEFIEKRVRLPEHGFVCDLARVELATLEVAEAATEPDTRLLSLSYPLDTWLRAPEPGPVPRPRKAWVAIYRRSFEVWRLGLERREYCFLRLLGQGHGVEQSLVSTCGTDMASAARLRAKLDEWRTLGLIDKN
jgi:hypothetical protein